MKNHKLLFFRTLVTPGIVFLPLLVVTKEREKEKMINMVSAPFSVSMTTIVFLSFLSVLFFCVTLQRRYCDFNCVNREDKCLKSLSTHTILVCIWILHESRTKYFSANIIIKKNEVSYYPCVSYLM